MADDERPRPPRLRGARRKRRPRGDPGCAPTGTPVRAVALAGGLAGSEIPPRADLVVVGCSQSHDQALEVTRQRAHSGIDRPVVVLYQGSTNGFLQRAFEAGADDLVELPQSVEQLAFALEKALARRRGSGPDVAEGAMTTVLGPKGGTGKTITSSNLAVALALEGKSAVLVDLDLQFGDVGLALGLEPSWTIYDLAVAGGSLDGDKIEGFTTSVRCASPARAASVRTRRPRSGRRFCARSSSSCARGSTSSRLTRPRRSRLEVIAAADASSHLALSGCWMRLLKDTKIGLETLSNGYDPNAVTFVLNRADSTSASRRPTSRSRSVGPRPVGRQRSSHSSRADERAADRSPSRGRTPRARTDCLPSGICPRQHRPQRLPSPGSAANGKPRRRRLLRKAS